MVSSSDTFEGTRSWAWAHKTSRCNFQGDRQMDEIIAKLKEAAWMNNDSVGLPGEPAKRESLATKVRYVKMDLLVLVLSICFWSDLLNASAQQLGSLLGSVPRSRNSPLEARGIAGPGGGVPKASWIPALPLPFGLLARQPSGCREVGSRPTREGGPEAAVSGKGARSDLLLHLFVRFAFGRELSWAEHHQVLRIEGLEAVT